MFCLEKLCCSMIHIHNMNRKWTNFNILFFISWVSPDFLMQCFSSVVYVNIECIIHNNILNNETIIFRSVFSFLFNSLKFSLLHNTSCTMCIFIFLFYVFLACFLYVVLFSPVHDTGIRHDRGFLPTIVYSLSVAGRSSERIHALANTGPDADSTVHTRRITNRWAGEEVFFRQIRTAYKIMKCYANWWLIISKNESIYCVIIMRHDAKWWLNISKN